MAQRRLLRAERIHEALVAVLASALLAEIVGPLEQMLVATPIHQAALSPVVSCISPVVADGHLPDGFDT
jgi:hypothetical protein